MVFQLLERNFDNPGSTVPFTAYSLVYLLGVTSITDQTSAFLPFRL